MTVDDAALAAAAVEVITRLAGPDASPRPEQLDAARALAVRRQRALVVQATGFGKSAVYFIAARALRDAGAGPTLVVSPLLSLMSDQVRSAAAAGLRAVTLNSGNLDDWSAIEADIRGNRVDLILVSPERLANPRFGATVLAGLLPRLGLLVIDEAHCISNWGHDFRPDYQRVARLLLARPDLPVLATTATANDRVTADVASQLGDDTYVQRGTLARASLHLAVVPALDPLQRYAWVDGALSALPGSGIVYVLTVAEAERLAGFLSHRGHAVASYTGGLEADRRAQIESALRAEELKAVVATSALGMGFDAPRVAFCLHVGSPASPVDYYQQVGRAGRALDTAVVALLPGTTDQRLWEWFATSSIPDPDQARAVVDVLEAEGSAMSVPAIEAATGVRRTRVELLVKTLAVDGAVDRTEAGWVATGRPWAYDHERYAGLLAARRAEADLMRDYAAGRRCLDTILRTALDDEVAPGARCGRCSVCTGALPAGLPLDPDADAVAAARTYLRGLDVVLEPRAMWPPGGLGAWRGRIPASLAIEPGRAVAFADDAAWPDVPGLVDGPDAEAPDWLVEAVVAVLARWSRSWAERPRAVAPMPSSRPVLLSSLARAVADAGRLPVIEPLTSGGPPPDPGLAPAARARAQRTRLGLAGPVPAVPVLLVDDVWRTGWTATIAGALLREAGASAVLPLAVHRRP